MKKLILIFLSLTLFFVGCSDKQEETESETYQESENEIIDKYTSDRVIEGYKTKINVSVSRSTSYFNWISADIIFNNDNKDTGIIEKEVIKSKIKELAKKEFELDEKYINIKSEDNKIITNIKIDRDKIEEKMTLDNISFEDSVFSIQNYLKENNFTKIN